MHMNNFLAQPNLIFRNGLMAGVLFATCLSTNIQAADLSACTCNDLRDMQSRRAQAGVAVMAYIKLLQEYQRLGSTYNKAAYNTLQQTEIQPAMDAYCEVSTNNYCPVIPNLDDPDANGPSNTSNVCWIYVVENTTPCLKAILTGHEEFHQKTCRANSDVGGSVIVGHYWKDRLGLRGSFLDEQQSYMYEIELIDARLAALGSCTNPQPTPHADTVMDEIFKFLQIKTLTGSTP